MTMPVNSVGGPSAIEIIQQTFNPAITVLASPDVDLVCSKNRLTFVELLQPFSRLSIEGQIRDVNQVLHPVQHFRLSIRDVSWKPASSILARRLLSDAVISHTANESRVIVVEDGNTNHSIEVNPHTPWYDSWRDTLWNCLELTDHDFTRHYLGTLLVVSSSHPNPLEQMQQLNDQLSQLMSSNGTADGPRWFNTMSIRYYVLVHDSCEGDAVKAEGLFQTMRNTYGAQSCHLLVINSKPKKGAIAEPSLPAPDPWLRFLPRKQSKRPIRKKSEMSMDGESVVDGVEVSESELPNKVVEGSNLQSLGALPKIPLMDALQEAMQEINVNSIFPPSASTTALSALSGEEKSGSKVSAPVSQRSAVEIKDDPLSAVQGNISPHFSSGETDGSGLVLAPGIVENELHGACLTTEDLDRIQGLVNEFSLKALLPHMERQMKLLNESASSRKSTHRSLLSATKRWFGSNRPGGVQTPQTVAVSYHPESPQLQTRRLGDLAFLLGHYELAYNSYHSAKKDFEADQAWLHYAGSTEMAALSVFLQHGQNRNIPFHYFDKALTTYLQTCKMPYWATRCAVLASECLKSANQYSEAALQLIRLTSEDADLRSAVLLEQAALCFLRLASKPNSSDSGKPIMTPLIRKYAFHMILAGHRFGKSGQKRHAARAYQLALQVYKGHGWSLAEDHIHYTVGRQCLNRQQIEAACKALAALLKPDSMQTAAQQTAYLNEFIHVHQLLNKHRANEASGSVDLPVLPLPVIECNKIRILMDTKVSTEIRPPGILEATHVTFSDEEVHDTKWAYMEEKLVHSAFGSVPPLFRPTNVLFSETTNNTSHPQAYCHDLISFEVPLTNPLRIPVQLCDIRLVWNFTGIDGYLSSKNLAMDNPLVTTYVVPRIILNHSSSHKIILSIKPKVEGMLTIEGIAFDLRPVNVDPAATVVGLVSSVSGQVTFSLKGPRLNGTQHERHNKVYAADKRLSIQVGPSTPKLQALFHSLPEFLFSGEVRSVVIELSNISPSVPIGDIIVASYDPLHVAIELPRIESTSIRCHDLALYRWDPSKKSTTMWLRGTENVGLTSLDLMFLYTYPAVNAKYRLLRHCSKIFVSSSLNLGACVQTVPSGENRKETLAIQLQVRNLRDADDTSLSGIEVYQVALLSKRWQLRPTQSVIPDGVLHPQESFFGVLMAVHESNSSDHSESVTLKLPPSGRTADFTQEPYRSFVKEFQRINADTTMVVCWTATQAAEDGFGTLLIEGQHYFGWNPHEDKSLVSSESNSKTRQLITYSMEYSANVWHDFNKQRLCIIPVTLYLHNCCQQHVEVIYSANSNAGKPIKANQLYVPEAAAPLLWIGRVQGQVLLKDKPETVQLTVAVSRPGAYSLVQGLNIVAKLIEDKKLVEVTSPKYEYTLIVDHKEV